MNSENDYLARAVMYAVMAVITLTIYFSLKQCS